MKETITIIGSGYVGLSSAAIFANAGYKVYALDIDEKKIKIIRSGRSHFYELGLDYFIAKAIKKGNLIPTISYEESIPNSTMAISCVGTPDNPDGSYNMSYIFSSAEETAKYAKNGLVYVQKSTVPVGTGEKVMKHIKKVNPKLKVHYVSNPEFLREGSAVFDTLNMDRIVVGGNGEDARKRLIAVYKKVDDLAKKTDMSEISKYAGVTMPSIKTFDKTPFIERVLETSLESAELIKVSSNAFLSLKITFANSIAQLCDKTGADIVEVMNGVGMDHRIGRAFLYAGRGYGGGCFPKDVSGLLAVADEHDVDLKIMKSSVQVNEEMPQYIVEKMIKEIPDLKKKKVALLGLSFKPGTSDTRKSPSIKLANLLVGKVASIKVYDPEAEEEAKPHLEKDVELMDTVKDTLDDADVAVIATDWPQFKDLNLFKKVDFVVDGMNALDKEQLRKMKVKYIGVGR